MSFVYLIALYFFLRICLWALYFGQTSRKCSISSLVAHVSQFTQPVRVFAYIFYKGSFFSPVHVPSRNRCIITSSRHFIPHVLKVKERSQLNKN